VSLAQAADRGDGKVAGGAEHESKTALS